MAIISEIRKRSVLLIIVIGLAMAGFVLMDALNSDSSILRGRQDEVGIIAGEEIAYRQYADLVDRELDVLRLFQEQKSIDNETTQEVRDDTWRKLVRDILYGEQYKQLGIALTDKEMVELIQGPRPHPAVQEFFVNRETGVYDPMEVSRFIQNMDQDPSGQSRQRWEYLKRFVQESQLVRKYTATLQKGLYVPEWQAAEIHRQKNTTANIDYLFFSYRDIPDAEIAIAESEVRTYIDAHRREFARKDETRTVEYVAFPILPSAEDTSRVEGFINGQIDAFRNAEDDSIFVRRHSDTDFDRRYFTLEQLQERTRMADSLFNVGIGTVLGPYYERIPPQEGDVHYQAAKLSDRKLIPDSVRARHILLQAPTRQDYEQAHAHIDSMKAAIERGDSAFAELARRHSADQQNAEKGGDLEWLRPGETVRPFNDFLFYQGEAGSMKKIETQFGIHLVQITEANPTTEAVQVAFLTRRLIPSAETERNIYKKARRFAATCHTGNDFDKGVAAHNLAKRTAEQLEPGESRVAGLGLARELVRWAYNNKVGKLSDVLSLNEHFVVAKLAQVVPKGEVPIEEVRGRVEAELRRAKKAEQIRKQLEPYLKEAASLEELATKMDKNIRSASDIRFANSVIPDMGREPKVVGAAFGLEAGTRSQPIAGENGVYVIEAGTFIPAQEPRDYRFERQQKERSYATRSETGLLEALRAIKTVKDQRYRFY